ncbi:MAG TPA: hypothetical protein VD764_10610, partial [Nocardioides sp.]|nr:hypothetical protein [Nocardioides sp.]
MRRSLGTAVAALALAVLVGCTGSGTGSGGADSSTDEGAGVPGAAPEKPGEAAGDTDADRQVVTTASASVAVEDPADGA